jgi:putative glycosyltransferase
MDLSIVTTLYRSAPHLEEFYARASAAAMALTSDYEIVLVNDGSPDNSLEVALRLFEKDERVRIVDLSRNFGNHKAVMTGLAHARGNLVFLLDCELEEDPGLLETFYQEMKESGADVVYGVEAEGSGGFRRRVWERALRLVIDESVARNALTLRLMTRRYVLSLIQHQDHEVFLPGLMAITGFVQIPCPVKRPSTGAQPLGQSHTLRGWVEAVTAFSNKPLVTVFYLGCGISVLAGTAAAALVIHWLFLGGFLSGWPSLMVSIWLLGGLTIFCLGVLGIYLARVFMETKRRPYTVVKALYERSSDLKR